MPVTNWNTTTINGKKYLVIESAQFRVPLDWDPSSNMFLAVAAPNGALGNFPALLKGDPGDTVQIDSAVDLTTLDYDDPTPNSASFTEISPGLNRFALTWHEGKPGKAATLRIGGASDLRGSWAPGNVIVKAANGFTYDSRRIGDRHVPAMMAFAIPGFANNTLARVAIPAQDFDWRPHCEGSCVITGTGDNVAVDLVARVGSETAGNIVARAFGRSGQHPPAHQLVAAPPAGSSDSFDRVKAGTATTIYLRAERQSGSDYYFTDVNRTLFSVRVEPIP